MSLNKSGKADCIVERRALERAERKKTEAVGKIELLKKWTTMLEHKAGKMTGPCFFLSNLLEDMKPRALNRLDKMQENLEAYLQPNPKTSPEK